MSNLKKNAKQAITRCGDRFECESDNRFTTALSFYFPKTVDGGYLPLAMRFVPKAYFVSKLRQMSKCDFIQINFNHIIDLEKYIEQN